MLTFTLSIRFMFAAASCAPCSDAAGTHMARGPRFTADTGVASATAAASRVLTWRCLAGRVSERFTPSMGEGAFPVSEMEPTDGRDVDVITVTDQ